MLLSKEIRKPTVLCVEDEKGFRENIVEFLSHESFDVIEAENAIEGIKHFKESTPDIVLCDVQMPGMNGLDMLNSLKETCPDKLEDTRFMFLSALGDKEHMLSGYHLGCDDYIVKPIDYDLLLAKLNRQLERAHIRDFSSKKPLESIEQLLAEFIQIHLQRPLHGMIGYGELLTDASSRTFPMYLERVKATSNEQLQSVRTLSAVMNILANRHEIVRQEMKCSSLLWEASVTALGYEMAKEMAIETDSDDLVRLENQLYHLLLDRFMRDVYRYTQKPMIFETEKAGNNMVVSCYSQAFSQKKQKQWLSIDDFIKLPTGREALVFHSITVALAMAMEQILNEPVEFAIQSESSIAIRLHLPLAA